ncbi:MAG: thiamine-monophosphate kinase [Akkermansiaceae bacterium]
MTDLENIGEDDLVQKLVALVPTGERLAGPGDDCAVIDNGGERLLLLKTDALVEGVHYCSEAEADRVGWKAVARVVSDFAAMGGVPEQFLVTIAVPGSMALEWIENFYRGMGRCLREFDAVLAGGETCRVPEGSAAVMSISATGSVERGKLVTRSGGELGDEIWVTGRLGGSLKGKHLDFSPRVRESSWLVKNYRPTAMMDLSDGIASDLPRLAAACGCGYEIDERRLPISPGCLIQEALCDGEDFELLFTIPNGETMISAWKEEFPELELTRIGRLVEVGEGDDLQGGWDHFRK